MKTVVRDTRLAHRLRDCTVEYDDIVIRTEELQRPIGTEFDKLKDKEVFDALAIRLGATSGNSYLATKSDIIGFQIGEVESTVQQMLDDGRGNEIDVERVYFWLPVEPHKDGNLRETFDFGEPVKLHQIIRKPSTYEPRKDGEDEEGSEQGNRQRA